MRIFSGIQPTGTLHLGNYLGAVRNWAALQEKEGAETIYCIVDYHAITADYQADELTGRTLEMARDLLACGIDPDRSTLFVQSHVPEHTELAWIFQATSATYGELRRMTQFRAKAGDRSTVSAGLFTYPVLQAADILLYHATHVPVGEDQVQHLELSREIARRFNARFGETFPEVEPMLTETPRIMSLRDPEQKMSKSAGEGHFLPLIAGEGTIRKMVRRAVTDVGPRPEKGMSPGVANLFAILRSLGEPEVHRQLLDAYEDEELRYVDLKGAVADALCDLAAHMRERREALSPDRVRRILAAGAETLRPVAEATLETVRGRLGLHPLPPAGREG